ncbi:PREDICTED: protein MOR1-like isoform X1 [Lupinus angustifolius]|uniref:protein MOR1-like isoform X1 n=2 Tax=Lupinus angustifolius TaxID=3871 RepID=UPI00092E7EE5|nr:PREDICTED: protein MOR1-like isoform X1 [Lupinus angustifolius]XP_019427923.1 PREDICTED: protein MOR1-like isoform X1 [Lupinus angustifolius]
MSEEEKLLKDAKKLPWEDRLSHKNWKVRNEANIDLASLCDSISDPKDPRIREFGHFFKKTVTDSNAPVQEKALDALIAYLRAADADAGRYGKEVCDAVVAKCLTGRTKTVEKAQAVFMLWVELEAVDAFLDSMEKAIKNKVAKAVVPAIDVMFQALSEFGAKIVPPKRLLKMLPELFDHPDQNVRASSKGLTLELCRWIGKDHVKAILFEKMRDTMKKELEAELVNVTGTAKPSRKIRSEQDKEPEQEAVSEVVGPGPSEESGNDGPTEIDQYDLVDPVDILTPLEKSGFWEGVKATKWSERKEAVAELTKLASIIRISPGDFSEVCRTLKKLITDVNIAVAVEAIQAIGNLARGLRTHFSASSRFLLPTLLEKLKEKKPTSSEALTQTLQAMHKAGCISLTDIVEDVKTATKNKVPLVRSLTLTWVAFCIETSNKGVITKVHKDYVPICMESLNDGTPDVRDASFSVLAAIAKSVGMRPLEKSLEKLDDVRRKKLSEMISGSEDAVPGGCATAPVHNTRAGMSSAESSESAFVKRSAASMLSGKRPVQAAPVIKKGGVAKTGTNKKVDGVAPAKASKSIELPEDVEPSEMSLDEIESRIGSLVQSDTITLLKSAVWKERLEAITSLKQQVEGLQELDRSVEILIRLLCILPGWSEKNVQVQQQVIEVITHIASTAIKFPKKCVVLCLSGLSERVADIKTRAHAMKCLTTFSEAVGPGFIFERLYKIMKEHKNPKVLSEGILWMVSAVEDFGVSHLKLKDLIDFLKEIGLQSSAAATRNASIKLLGVLHKFVGPDIKGFLTEVKPALLSALDTEYGKNPFEGASAAPKRAVRVSDSSSSVVAGGLDSLPREDISGKITPTLLKCLESPDWKVRMESVESVNKILEEANKRIQATGTGELFGALRGRLFDSNKNIVMATLTTIGNVASAMGQAAEKSSKGLLSDILKCLGDNKKHMRECALNTLDTWLAAVHFDKMVPYVTIALTDSKLGAEGRKDLFDWLSKQLSGLSSFAEAAQLLKPAASSLTDKSSDVRKAAEACINEIVRVSGHEMIEKMVKDIHGPALALVLDKLKPHGAFHESFETTRAVSAGVTSKGVLKAGKSTANGVSKHGSRAISSRTVITKGTRSDSITVQDIAVQSQALLNVKDSNKEDRERMVVRRFKFEDPRIEQIQDLENDMMKYFREDLHRRLLSADFKKQVDGLEMLQKALPSISKEIIEVLDILLKWFVLQFCKSNTTCLLKVLEFLPELLDILKDEGYSLTESEVALFLPCLVEKLGHNIEKVREKMRELTKQFVLIYSASKCFPYILEGLRSKNNRTRIECADLIGFIIDHHVAEISGQLKSLQIVASLTAERDGEIRKAALNTLATGYKIIGEDIWRFVGKLSDAQKSMLDDRFKWKVREMEKKKEGKPGEARAILRRSVRENGSDVAEQSGEIARSLSGPILRKNYAQPDVNIERQLMPRPLPVASGPTNWNEALDIISFGSPEQSVEGMKVVCHELAQAISDPEGSAMDELVKDADRLVSCLANKVARTFDFSLTGASSRSCKYVLNTLMQTFQNKRLAYAVKESTLDSLITELLLWLLDDRVPQMDDGSQLLKALNVLMLKILDNADRTSSFVVLINLLRPLDPSRWPSPASNESFASRNQKFSDLVVKCLIKLTKVLQSTIYEVDLDRILQSIHLYLQDLGMEEIRRRAGADDKPLRMVKTVLHELVKLRGAAIKGHLSMVPIDAKPQPIILAYIELNLETLAAARMLTASGPGSQNHWGDSATNNSASGTHSADVQLKQELAAIFKKIGEKQTCTIGLYELYRITQLYPKVDIFAQLQNASEAFRTYIRDGLAQMEKNAAAGRTPSSIPMSTPPPASLNISSPDFAPLSPVNANPLGDAKLNVKPEPTNFNLPPSYNEENRAVNAFTSRTLASDYTSGDQRNERFMTGVTSGTLDAIRERMKSMQLAAAGTTDSGTRPLTSVNENLNHGFPPSQIPHASEHAGNENTLQGGVLPMDEKALSGLQARMERLKSGSLEPL